MTYKRKFLFDKLPNELQRVDRRTILLNYFSTCPNITFFKELVLEKDNFKVNHYLEQNTKYPDGERKKDLLSISEYDSFKRVAMGDDITIVQHNFLIPGDLVMSYNYVDPTSKEGFSYAEVCFENKNDADLFRPLWYIGEEVTDNDNYNLTNYFINTRLKDRIKKDDNVDKSLPDDKNFTRIYK